MRHELSLTIAEDGRDKGKVFYITEMGARPGHKWATRAIFAVMNSGVDIPDDILAAGMAGLPILGMKAIVNVPYYMAEPLLDELLTCVEFIPDAAKPNVKRKVFEDDIEEVKTIFTLQQEILRMHLAPFMTGGKSTSALPPTPTATAS